MTPVAEGTKRTGTTEEQVLTFRGMLAMVPGTKQGKGGEKALLSYSSFLKDSPLPEPSLDPTGNGTRGYRLEVSLSGTGARLDSSRRWGVLDNEPQN